MIAINRADLGLDPESLLTLQMEVPEWKYGPERVAPFYEGLLRDVEALPGGTGKLRTRRWARGFRWAIPTANRAWA
jgi:hypothetical protein